MFHLFHLKPKPNAFSILSQADCLNWRILTFDNSPRHRFPFSPMPLGTQTTKPGWMASWHSSTRFWGFRTCTSSPAKRSSTSPSTRRHSRPSPTMRNSDAAGMVTQLFLLFQGVSFERPISRPVKSFLVLWGSPSLPSVISPFTLLQVNTRSSH